MKKILGSTLLIAAVLFLEFSVQAQEAGAGPAMDAAQAADASQITFQPHRWYVPPSSVERPEDLGVRFHTHYVLPSRDGVTPSHMSLSNFRAYSQALGPDATISEPETPQSMGCLYRVGPTYAGCAPNSTGGTGGPQSGGWGAIALVDAYDNPKAGSDLANFSSYWGLPAATFLKIYANGNGDCTTPRPDAGWAVESSLDIEWAHVMAPQAVILLVEACSNSGTDLFYAEQVATHWVASYGGGAVSNSWGGAEFSGETANDVYFSSTNDLGVDYSSTPIVYFVSAGDVGCGAAYPSVVPWVVSAGGTTVLRNATTGAFSSESCWSGSGGGKSIYETWTGTFTGGNVGPWADYQYPIFKTGHRATPDMSFNADPSSGVWVLSQYGFSGCSGMDCYQPIGGTSVAAPSLAGIVNHANNRLGEWTKFPITGAGYYNAQENTFLYSQLGTTTAYKANFYDVKTGSNTTSQCSSKATLLWDYCTGVGSPRGLLGK